MSKELSPTAQAETKHSPGPWKHDKTFPTSVWANERWIASTNVGTVSSLAEREANARLIAVSPELLALVLAHDQHGYCPNCGCDLWNTKGCPTCPLMRQGRDILVKLGMAKPRQYAEWAEPDEINNRNLAKAEKQP